MAQCNEGLRVCLHLALRISIKTQDSVVSYWQPCRMFLVCSWCCGRVCDVDKCGTGARRSSKRLSRNGCARRKLTSKLPTKLLQVPLSFCAPLLVVKVCLNYVQLKEMVCLISSICYRIYAYVCVYRQKYACLALFTYSSMFSLLS